MWTSRVALYRHGPKSPGTRQLYPAQNAAFRTSFLRHNSVKEQPRVNPFGIQYLSHDLHRKVFPKVSSENYLLPDKNGLVDLAKEHLDQSGLLGKKTQISEPISIPNFPDLVGKSSLNEHFTRIGAKYSEPYLSMAKRLFSQTQLPPQPSSWQLVPGWTRYAPGEIPQPVPYPTEHELVFDVEVLYKVAPYAVLATAASPKAWYGWVSPVLAAAANGATPGVPEFSHLIPLDTQNTPKLLVGYNVSYDRARVLEEYNIKQSQAFFLDIMALHIAISGFCSRQRPLYLKHRKNKAAANQDSEEEGEYPQEPSDVAQELMDDPWLDKGSPNSLANVAEFHCGINMDKSTRDLFGSEDIGDIVANFQDLMTYCAKDVDVTFQVGQKVFPEFQRRAPHPVSFSALKQMGQLFLPVTKKWEQYLQKSEQVYQENRNAVTQILVQRVQELVDASKTIDYESDPWLRQMNWTIKSPRLRKDGTPYAKQAFMTGLPEWYRELFKTKDPETGDKKITLTVRTRITPLLLKLKWEGYPLIWTNSCGWCFKIPYEEHLIEEMLAKNYTKAKLSEEDMEVMLPELRDDGNVYELFKVPHPEGPSKRCTLIMSKSYQRFFESGVLTSEYGDAARILGLNATASYWMGSRARIQDQFVVYSDAEGKKNQFFKTKKEAEKHRGMGMIIPKLCTMGTVTRRATENTWLTASNSKKNRIGSELKAMVQAPKGYVFVGADVDSEELWIASLIGDSLFKTHGATALGWMTLEGDKNEKTDLHSKTASIMGISRNDAKVFNYGRIYGAGVKFATQLLKQCNASLSDGEAEKKAQQLYLQTKGMVGIFNKKKVYYGGTESVMFNTLEAIAHEESPRTPVLGAAITDALTSKHLNKNAYLTSRVNWTIQSSGVDYLHLLVVSMQYLTEKFSVDARLMITVHDELRYMVREDQKLLCSLLLQISNVWTRAMFCEQLGLQELPQSCAFFSEVDVDHVLRKEVTLDCVTPSHEEAIPVGESYDIQKLLGAFDSDQILREKSGILTKLPAQKPKPAASRLDADLSDALKLLKLKMQTSMSRTEWTRHMQAYYKQSKKGTGKSHSSEPPGQARPRKRPLTEHTLGEEGDALLKEQIEQDSITKRSQKVQTQEKGRVGSQTSTSRKGGSKSAQAPGKPAKNGQSIAGGQSQSRASHHPSPCSTGKSIGVDLSGSPEGLGSSAARSSAEKSRYGSNSMNQHAKFAQAKVAKRPFSGQSFTGFVPRFSAPFGVRDNKTGPKTRRRSGP